MPTVSRCTSRQETSLFLYHFYATTQGLYQLKGDTGLHRLKLLHLYWVERHNNTSCDWRQSWQPGPNARVTLECADILCALPWCCCCAKQKHHNGQQCQDDSPVLAIPHTSHSTLWPQSVPASSTSASFANYSARACLGNSVCSL